MSFRTAYPLTEARNMLTLWKDAEAALASGRVKEYTIGTRTLKKIDLDEIEKMIQKYANLVEALSGEARTTRVVRVVPRDL